MSNEIENSNGTEQLSKKPKDAFNKGKKGFNLLKNAKQAGKIIKFFFNKVLLSFGKWLLATLGPFVIGFIVLIVLLLIVLDSVIASDWFQMSNEREEVEVVFDDTVRSVFTEQLEKTASEIRDTIRPTQLPPDYPPISEEWLYETGELMKISHAIPTIHHYSKNLKNENYKPWHKSHTNTPEEEYFKIIEEEMAYYFEDESYQVEYEWGVPPIEEYIQVDTTTVCTYVDEETGETTTTTSSSSNKRVLPVRDIVLSMRHIYHKGTIHYNDVFNVTEEDSSDGNCSTHTRTESRLYLLDDSTPITLEFLAKELVLYLTTDAAEGKRTQLVKAQDLEYMIDIGREADVRFPKPDIDYEGLTACYFEKKSVPPCIDEFVKGGSLGDILYVGGFYPPEYEELYKKAAEACGIDWEILAAVHGVETTFSTNPVATDKSLGSSAGAVGHYQFMRMTWLGWSAKSDLEALGLETTGSGNIIGETSWLTDPAMIAKYGGKGRDGDGDGIADPWNLSDAMVSAACYLRDIGYKKGDEESIKTTLAKYNQGSKPSTAGYNYANKVVSMATRYKNGGSAPIGVLDGDVTYPALGTFTSPYGMRKLPDEAAPRMHYGIDIANSMNSPIVSVADGVVTAVQNTGSGWGKLIRVQHDVNGNKFETLYAHLNDFNVQVGQSVSKGQTIGAMGCTGRSYSSSGSCGVHLHLEVHVPSYKGYGVSNVNPTLYIPLPPGN